MKKITALLLTATMAFSLAGCNKTEEVQEEQLNNETVVQEEIMAESDKETEITKEQDNPDTNSYEYNGKLYEFNEDTKYWELDEDEKMVWWRLMKTKEYFIKRFTEWDRHTPFSQEYHKLFILRDDFEDIVKYHAVARIEFKDFDVDYTFEDEILTIDGEVIENSDRLYEIFAELGDSTEGYKSEYEIIDELTNIPFTKENHQPYINHPNFKEIIESVAMDTPLPSEVDARRTYEHDEINFYNNVVIDGKVVEDVEELYAFIQEHQYVEPAHVAEVEEPEEVSVVENTTEESTTSPTQEKEVATSSTIWDIPRYDQSDVYTREDLFASKGTYVGKDGVLFVYTSPNANEAGVARDLFEAVLTKYNSTDTEYIYFNVDTRYEIDDKYKTQTYKIKDDTNRKLVFTQFGLKIGDDIYHNAFNGTAYTKDPYSTIDIKNNKSNNWWLDYSRVVDGMIVEYADNGSGVKVSQVFYLKHDDYQWTERSLIYQAYNATYEYDYEFWMELSEDGIY